MIGRVNTGGGIKLPFRVIGGTTQPSNPKDGTIWVKTSTPIMRTEFANGTWASGGVGLVFLAGTLGGSNPTGTNSTVWAINKNTGADKYILKITLTGCKQVQGSTGNWVNLDAYRYYGGKWVQFSSEFTATINITYPAGSTCKATDGKTTLTAPNTSGTWACVVPNAGTWTVMLSSGFYADVSVAASNETIILNEWYLYDAGNEYDSLTGGFIAEKLKGANNNNSSYTITKNEDNITFSASVSSGGGSCIRNNTPITLSGFSTLHFRYDIVKRYTRFSISIVPENYDHWKNSAIAYAEFNNNSTVNSQNETVTLPVSPDAVSSGKFYVILAIWQNSWAETHTTTITARKLYFT